MQRFLSLLIVLLLTAGCSLAPNQQPVELVVSAAASLTDALKEAQKEFEAQEKAVVIRFNFGSSGALQQQIEQGAPVDLFIAAAAGPMEGLDKKGLVEQAAVQPLAANSVVLVRSKTVTGAVNAWEDLAKARRVAMGNPQHVPVGQYGKAVLEKLNLWPAVEPRLVLAEDVRQVLQFVESGEVDAGILYRTDAIASAKVVVIAEAPAGSHKPVVYPMAVLAEAKHKAEAKRFVDFLRSPKGREILTRFGFKAAD